MYTHKPAHLHVLVILVLVTENALPLISQHQSQRSACVQGKCACHLYCHLHIMSKTMDHHTCTQSLLLLAGMLPVGLAVLTAEAGSVKERKRDGASSVPETPSVARANAALPPMGPGAYPLECSVRDSALIEALPLQPRERAVVPVIVHAAQVQMSVRLCVTCRMCRICEVHKPA